MVNLSIIMDWLYVYIIQGEIGLNPSGLFPAMLISRQCHAQTVAYYFKEWNGFRMPYHAHDDTEIMYIISGVCRVEIDSGQSSADQVTLKKGEFIILNANQPHRLLVDEDAPCRMLNIEFRFIDGAGRQPTLQQLADEDASLRELLLADAAYLVLRDPDEVYHTLKNLVLELDSAGSANGSMVHMQLMQLLVRVGRLFREQVDSVSQQTDLYVKKSISYLHQNYDRDIQVKDIAAAVSLHPGYLHRIFKAQTGQSIMKHYRKLKIDQAKQMIREQRHNFTEISELLHYSSVHTFSRHFKLFTGMSPSEYAKTVIAKM